MKILQSRFWIIGSLFLLILGAIGFVGCKDSETNHPLVVGVLIGPEYAAQADIIIRAAKDATSADGRGVLVTEKFNKSTTQAYHDAFAKLKSSQVGEDSVMGFVLAGNPAIDLKEDIRGTSLSGKPIIVFGEDYPETERDFFVHTDNALTGKLLGEQIGHDPAPGSKVIAILTGSVDNEKQLQIVSNLRNELVQYARVSVLKTITYENNKQAADDLRNLLTQTPNLFAIVSTGPWIFEPSVKSALYGYKGKIYAAANTPEAFEAVKDGKAEAIVANDLYQEAFLAAKYCLMRLRSISVHQTTLPQPILITQKNLPQVMESWGKRPLATASTTKDHSKQTETR